MANLHQKSLSERSETFGIGTAGSTLPKKLAVLVATANLRRRQKCKGAADGETELSCMHVVRYVVVHVRCVNISKESIAKLRNYSEMKLRIEKYTTLYDTIIAILEVLFMVRGQKCDRSGNLAASMFAAPGSTCDLSLKLFKVKHVLRTD